MHSSVPSISVAMSVYNGERFLAAAIESILAQSFADFEFLILDDGSRDASRASGQ
jgi:glycosyltransferase involved in cell wall biosynthesis